MTISTLTFSAVILQNGNMNAAYVNFPFSVEELFGTRGQVKIKAVFDGSVSYRGSLANMGGGRHCLGLTQAVRKELGKTFGDEVTVELQRDTEARTVEIAPDIQQILSENPEAQALLSKMSYTHKKEYINWIEEAKKPETRDRRKLKMIEMLLSGKRGI